MPGAEDTEPDRAPGEEGEAGAGDEFEAYQTVAETVGGVPSLRLRDNVIQGIVVAVGTALGAIVGHALLAGGKAMGRIEAALLGAGAGLIASALLSGIVLMVLGWIRAAKKVSKGDEQ